MQQYAEVLVHANQTEKMNRSKKMIWGGGILAVAAVIALSAYFMGQFPQGMGWTVIPFTLLFVLLIAWGVLCALEGLQTEYEYAISDQSITVDCIRAKKRRKQMLHLPLSMVTAFGELKEPQPKTNRTLLDASGTPVRSGTWYLDYHNENGDARLILCPNDAALEILQRALRRVTVREGWK